MWQRSRSYLALFILFLRTFDYNILFLDLFMFLNRVTTPLLHFDSYIYLLNSLSKTVPNIGLQKFIKQPCKKDEENAKYNRYDYIR